MPTVYRFEHSKATTSVYATYLAEFSKSHSDNDNYHPTPSRDEGTLYEWWWNESDYELKKQFHCGFRSKRQMFRWFPKENLERMAKNQQLRLVVYKVRRKHIKHGKCQLMFHKRYAEQVQILRPNHFN